MENCNMKKNQSLSQDMINPFYITDDMVTPFTVKKRPVTPFVVLEKAVTEPESHLSLPVTSVPHTESPFLPKQREASPIALKTKIVAGRNGLLIIGEEDGSCEQLCNYIIRPVRLTRCITARSEINFIELALQIDLDPIPHSISIAVSDLDGVAGKIQKQYPNCWMNPDIAKSAARISTYVRQHAVDLPTCTCFQRTGWQQVHDRFMFVHDGREKDVGPNIRLDTQKTILEYPLAAKDACAGAFAVLRLSADPAKIVPIFLFAHLALLWSVFDAAGYPPQFALFLSGQTGSFKTAVAKTIFSFFNAGAPAMIASFRDTPAAIEQQLAETFDSVLILDDFHPASTRSEKAALDFNLEQIVRATGDTVGKNRGSFKRELVAGTRPHGLVAITGEDTSGSMSTMLRCLIIDVKRGTFDKIALTELQADPVLWTTHLSRFLRFVEANYQSVRQKIISNFCSLRNEYAPFFDGANRLLDSAVCLILTEQIVLEYLRSCNAKCDFDGIDTCWRNAIIQALTTSKELASHADPSDMFISAMQRLYAMGRFPLAKSRTVYKSQNGFYGFWENDWWWLVPELAFKAVQDYWQALGRTFSISLPATQKLLANSGLIRVQEEHRSTGEIKQNYTVKAYMNGKQMRFLVVNYGLMTKKLDDFIS